jgi:Fe2+ or Zn2+ uptake regulation protein
MAQLQDLFQTHAVVKILDHLTLYKDFEYTKTDIANETGISRRTLYQVWSILEKFDLVEVTKTSGMIKFYKLNTENSISRQLVALADKISFFETDKIAGIESVPVLQASLQTHISSSYDKESHNI